MCFTDNNKQSINFEYEIQYNNVFALRHQKGPRYLFYHILLCD